MSPFWKAVWDAFRPKGTVMAEITEKYRENELQLRTHLRLIDKDATQRLREATDEAAEFRRHASKS